MVDIRKINIVSVTVKQLLTVNITDNRLIMHEVPILHKICVVGAVQKLKKTYQENALYKISFMLEDRNALLPMYMYCKNAPTKLLSAIENKLQLILNMYNKFMLYNSEFIYLEKVHG